MSNLTKQSANAENAPNPHLIGRLILVAPDTDGIYSSGGLVGRSVTRTDVFKPQFVSADADKGVLVVYPMICLLVAP